MKNTIMKLAIVAAAGLASTGAYADSIELTDMQLDGVAAGGTETTTGFICPVISNDAVLHSPKSAQPEPGLYTIIGPDVTVSAGATNTLADGTSGNPHGAYASPGDTGYTAIWNTGG